MPDTIAVTLIPSVFQDFSLPGRVSTATRVDSVHAIASAAIILWFGGVLVTAWRFFRTGLRLSLGLKERYQPPTAQQLRVIELFCRRAGVFPAPRVHLSPDTDGPALWGMLNPVLLLPFDFFDRFTRSEQMLMISHELVHLRRKDGCWNLLFCVLHCIFWFNPLVRIAERRFRLDQEQSCDQWVLWDEPSEQRALYAAAMLKVAAPASSGGPIGFRNTVPEVFGRVAMIQDHRKSISQSVLGTIGLVVLLFAVVIVSAPATQAAYPGGAMSGWCTVYQGLGF
jgi:beta-lactamase regulating signal transducer with metallopeptidase domain